jgi:hypothetical protein
MTAIPSGFLAASLRPEPVNAPLPPVADQKTHWSGRRLLDTIDPLAFSRYLIAFFVGVVATVAWQCYLQSTGLAVPFVTTPPDQQINAILLDTVRRSIDRLAASQEQMTREIDKLQAGQFVLYRHPEPSARPTSAPATTPTSNPNMAPQQGPAEIDARADWRRQPCCQWPGSGVW